MVAFVNRTRELAALEQWAGRPGPGLALVWGRRRVGKTLLLQRFAESRRSVFHIAAGRPVADELVQLSRAAAPLGAGVRDLASRPFVSWDDALDHFAERAAAEPLTLVIDEFPELLIASPELPSVLRAWWDRVAAQTQLRLVLCGSAMRTMQAMQEERAPLFGRADLSLLVHPFEPHEAALMLPQLAPVDRAAAWAVLGGMPLYLSWWDQQADLETNLRTLVAEPGARLLSEGQLVLATDASHGHLEAQVLRAIAAGRTKHHEIADAVRAEPSRTLERLTELHLVERLVPVTDDPRRTRRRSYRITDNFLAFWLQVVEPHRASIERGLGAGVAKVLAQSVDDHAGPRWETAVQAFVRHAAADGRFGDDIVAVGNWWRDHPPVELDVVALAGRSRTPVLAGEVKWARRVDAAALLPKLRRRAELLAPERPHLPLLLAAREQVDAPGEAIVVTAADVFA